MFNKNLSLSLSFMLTIASLQLTSVGCSKRSKNDNQVQSKVSNKVDPEQTDSKQTKEANDPNANSNVTNTNESEKSKTEVIKEKISKSTKEINMKLEKIKTKIQKQIPPVVETDETTPSPQKTYVMDNLFQNKLNEIQIRSEREKEKVAIDQQKKKIKQKEDEIKNKLDNHYITLNARLEELNYIRNFLKMDDRAYRVVARSIDRIEPTNYFIETSKVAAVLGITTPLTYGVTRLAVPNFVKNNPVIGKTTAAVTLASAGVAVGAWAVDYFDHRQFQTNVDNETRKYLSNLASRNSGYELNYSQIDNLFTQRERDAEFGNAILTEVMNALNDIKNNEVAITKDRLELVKLKFKKENLSSGLVKYETLNDSED